MSVSMLERCIGTLTGTRRERLKHVGESRIDDVRKRWWQRHDVEEVRRLEEGSRRQLDLAELHRAVLFSAHSTLSSTCIIGNEPMLVL